MKVVLFCGGQGLRLRDGAPGAPGLPKPLQVVGGRPLLWHTMRWYARQGHTDFVLCTGYLAEDITQWFEQHAPELVEQESGDERVVTVRGGEMDGWRITFCPTGEDASVGMRLRAVRHLVADEPLFLANYADVFCDVDLDRLLAEALLTGCTALFTAVRPNHSFHFVELARDGRVSDIVAAVDSGHWINGGYFVLRQDVFDVLGPGEELVEEPFRRLLLRGQLRAHRHEGFWAPLDTAKDRQTLEAMCEAGYRPWEAVHVPGRVPAQTPDARRPAPVPGC